QIWQENLIFLPYVCLDMNLICQILAYGFQIQEVGEVISCSCFCVRTRHIEAAEWMLQNNSSGGLSVEVEISNMEFYFCFLDMFSVLCIYRSGQTILGSVCNFQCFVKGIHTDHSKYRSEDFFFCDDSVFCNV